MMASDWRAHDADAALAWWRDDPSPTSAAACLAAWGLMQRHGRADAQLEAAYASAGDQWTGQATFAFDPQHWIATAQEWSDLLDEPFQDDIDREAESFHLYLQLDEARLATWAATRHGVPSAWPLAALEEAVKWAQDQAEVFMPARALIIGWHATDRPVADLLATSAALAMTTVLATRLSHCVPVDETGQEASSGATGAELLAAWKSARRPFTLLPADHRGPLRLAADDRLASGLGTLPGEVRLRASDNSWSAHLLVDGGSLIVRMRTADDRPWSGTVHCCGVPVEMRDGGGQVALERVVPAWNDPLADQPLLRADDAVGIVM